MKLNPVLLLTGSSGDTYLTVVNFGNYTELRIEDNYEPGQSVYLELEQVEALIEFLKVPIENKK